MGEICVLSRQCVADYIEWFYMISYLFMNPTQPGDPPRHPFVVHNDIFVEPDIPQHPVVATTMDEAPAYCVTHFI